MKFLSPLARADLNAFSASDSARDGLPLKCRINSKEKCERPFAYPARLRISIRRTTFRPETERLRRFPRETRQLREDDPGRRERSSDNALET